MKIVQMLAHSIEEYDQVVLLSGLGHEVFSIGAYIDPAHPHDDKRPPVPGVPVIPEMKEAIDILGQPGHLPHGICHGRDPHPDPLDAAKRNLPDAVIEWADLIICHHLEHTWIVPQWERLRHKRVVWRTVGQSAHPNEWMMKPLHDQGMQILRYSPKERNLPEFAGEDALIRFYKDPEEWSGWTGEDLVVTNITQDLYRRSLADDGSIQPPGMQFTGFGYWAAATEGLSVRPGGPGSQSIGGVGPLSVPEMKDLLGKSRAYLYTGTQPASYTLGLIEAMMVGIPVVSIPAKWHRILPYGPLLFEGAEIAGMVGETVEEAHSLLSRLLEDPVFAMERSEDARQTAIDLFGRSKIEAEWKEFLG